MFKIIIQNFGPIQQCEFDVEQDLHLLYGKNSVGKSYAASCIYDLLKNLKKIFPIDSNLLSSNEKFNVLRKALVQKLEQLLILEDDTSKFLDKNDQPIKLKCLNVYSELVEIVKYFLEDTFLKSMHESFMNTYTSISNLDNRYVNKHFRVSIILGMYTITLSSNDSQHLELVDLKIDSTLEAIYSDDKNFGRGYHLPFSNHLFTFSSKESFAIDAGLRLLSDITVQLAKYFDQIYFLPASRSGLYQGLNSLSPIIAELSKSRSVVKSKIELPALSEPVADYFVELSTMEMTQTSNLFQAIIDKIEQHILHGQVQVQSQTKKLVFRPEQTDLILELSGVSSMVAELSPIVAYLKYIVPQKSQASHLLFIEEPEAHLHPEMQVKLMELFAELAQSGIKIFMTSHSNYMFNKLGNLLLEKKANATKTAVYHLVMTDQGSVVSDDMKVSPEGIDDCNFAIVSEELYNERMRLYEQIDQDNESFE